MLDGFEDIDYDITEEERVKLVPLFVKGFFKHIGKDKAITNRQIREGFAKTLKYNISDSKVRAIVNYIRESLLFDDYILCASSKGMYLSNDPEDMKRWLRSMEQRIMKQQKVYNKTKEKCEYLINKNKKSNGKQDENSKESASKE